MPFIARSAGAEADSVLQAVPQHERCLKDRPARFTLMVRCT